MTYPDLVTSVATRAGVSPDTARSVLRALSEVVSESLQAGQDVRVPGLGTLKRVARQARSVRSVHDHRKMFVGTTHAVRFRPAAPLVRSVRRTDDRTWRSEEYQDAWRLAETLLDDLELYHAAQRPPDVFRDDPDAHVHDACARSFGPLWERVRRTWSDRTPFAVRGATDLLAAAVRTRWSATVTVES